jgi:hypothetical protein
LRKIIKKIRNRMKSPKDEPQSASVSTPATTTNLLSEDIKTIRYEGNVKEIIPDLWITGVGIFVNFSLVFVYLFGRGGYINCLWILFSFLVVGGVMEWRHDMHEYHRFALIGSVILTGWVICDLLPWSREEGPRSDVYVAIDWVVQVLGMGLSLAYTALERDYFLVAQLNTLLWPMPIMMTNINIVVLFYTVGWFMTSIVDFMVGEPLKVRRMFMYVFPLLRSYTPGVITYFVLLCIYKTVQLYTTDGTLRVKPPTPASPPAPEDDLEDQLLPASPPELTNLPPIAKEELINIKKTVAPTTAVAVPQIKAGPVKVHFQQPPVKKVRFKTTVQAAILPPSPPPQPADQLGITFQSIYNKNAPPSN